MAFSDHAHVDYSTLTRERFQNSKLINWKQPRFNIEFLFVQGWQDLILAQTILVMESKRIFFMIWVIAKNGT